MKENKLKKGFTLLELLIVIAIIAILSVILIIVINPAETLKKSRDVQRMSDLNTLKTAIGLILTSSSTPYLSQNIATGGTCLSNTGSAAQIFYSYDAGTMLCTGTVAPGADAAGTFTNGDHCTNVTTGTANVDGTGWLPIAFNWMPGGAPISGLPIDPVNTVGTAAAPLKTDLTYRYACQSTGTGNARPSNVFELNAVLESAAYTSDDNKMTKDGGDNTDKYEVGTDIKLLPITAVEF